MKKSRLAALGLIVATLGTTGCAAVGPLPGLVYSNYKFPSIASQSGPGRKSGSSPRIGRCASDFA